jgi:hypothetical protein
MTSAFVKVDAKQDKFRKTYTLLSTHKCIAFTLISKLGISLYDTGFEFNPTIKLSISSIKERRYPFGQKKNWSGDSL